MAAAATDCRFTLADQSNYSANTGFYLDLENTPASATSYCQLANMTIAVGVADGSQWRFIVSNPAWVLNHNYTAQAVITASSFELYLDGQLLGEVSSGFSGLPNQDLLVNSVPSWASGLGNYLVTQSSLAAQAGGAAAVSAAFLADDRPVPLMLLAPGAISQELPFSYASSETLTITAGFSLTSVAGDPQSYAPYVDKYGQSVYSNFAGKIQTDADLAAAAAAEQTALAGWGIPTGYDAWGGVLNAGWQAAVTGFFHVIQRNAIWWLISPAGNPCFYIGLDTGPLVTGNNTPTTSREWEFAAFPPQTAPYNSAWSSGDWGNTGISSVSFDTWNMIRKYGSDNWQATANKLAVQRMQAWGFTGFGKWSSGGGNLPNLPVLEPYGVTVLVSHADVFDPNIQAQFQASLQQQIGSSVSDPGILGWSFGNEYDEIVTPAEISTILAMAGTVPCKQALVNQALNAIYGNDIAAMAAAWGVTATVVADLYNATPTPPAADIETLREFYADKYYAFIYQTIKGIDPNHLFFGFWIVPGWWVNSTDWKLQAAHVDVIGYDYYSPTFEDSQLQSLASSTAKPMFLGEFSFPPTYSLLRGYEAYPLASAPDEATAGAQYTANIQAAAHNPWHVGVAWFEYRDEPVSGRGFLGETDLDLVEGEDYAFGMVDVADTPKYDLVNPVRLANLASAQLRLTFAAPALNAGGTVSNASFASRPVAPGSIVSIFGTGLSDTNQSAAAIPLPTTLGTTALTLGAFPLPLIDAFPLQVDAQVPWELAGQTQAQLSVAANNLAGNTVAVPLAEFSPGVYTANGSGSGQGAILINGTSTLAAPGSPATRGVDYIDIFATGLGPVGNQPATGAPAPVKPLAQTTNPVSVTIGEVAAKVLFAGLAPGYVGLYQVNLQVPATAPTGDAVAVALSVGGVAANPVTMAID